MKNKPALLIPGTARLAEFFKASTQRDTQGGRSYVIEPDQNISQSAPARAVVRRLLVKIEAEIEALLQNDLPRNELSIVWLLKHFIGVIQDTIHLGIRQSVFHNEPIERVRLTSRLSECFPDKWWTQQAISILESIFTRQYSVTLPLIRGTRLGRELVSERDYAWLFSSRKAYLEIAKSLSMTFVSFEKMKAMPVQIKQDLLYSRAYCHPEIKYYALLCAIKLCQDTPGIIADFDQCFSVLSPSRVGILAKHEKVINETDHYLNPLETCRVYSFCRLLLEFCRDSDVIPLIFFDDKEVLLNGIAKRFSTDLLAYSQLNKKQLVIFLQYDFFGILSNENDVHVGSNKQYLRLISTARMNRCSLVMRQLQETLLQLTFFLNTKYFYKLFNLGCRNGDVTLLLSGYQRVMQKRLVNVDERGLLSHPDGEPTVDVVQLFSALAKKLLSPLLQKASLSCKRAYVLAYFSAIKHSRHRSRRKNSADGKAVLVSALGQLSITGAGSTTENTEASLPPP